MPFQQGVPLLYAHNPRLLVHPGNKKSLWAILPELNKRVPTIINCQYFSANILSCHSYKKKLLIYIATPLRVRP